jgi:hypothetical protein
LLSHSDVMIDGNALQNPGSQGLESNWNLLFPGVKQLGTHQGVFDSCHCAAGRGFWALSWWQIAKHCQFFCEFLYQLTFENPQNKTHQNKKNEFLKEEDFLGGAAIGFVSSLAK